MNEISIEAIFLKHPTSLISDALDELNINGAISGVFPQRYDQGRIAGRALPVKFSKNFLILKLEIWWRCWKTSRASSQNHVNWENHYNGS